jgi:hypothetical protein
VSGGIAVLNYFTYYEAEASASRPLPIGGNLLTAGIDATVYADSLTALYQGPWDVLGGGLAFGVSVPYVWLEISGSAQRVVGGVPQPAITISDSANGIGDMILIPFMLGWTNIMPDLKVDTRLTVYAPTGEYNVGDLANVGKNYWTFEPGIMASWISSKIGTEVSLYAGIDFNTENSDTDYTSGTSLHFDLTVAQHLPVGKGIIGVGANGFYYEQITGDSGSGARFGDFEGMTMGVGPVISYIHPIGSDGMQLLAEAKWLPELDTDRRLEGDYIWFKLGLLF